MLERPREAHRVPRDFGEQLLRQLLRIRPEQEARRELRDGLGLVCLTSAVGERSVPEGVQPTQQVMGFEASFVLSQDLTQPSCLDQCLGLQRHAKILFGSQSAQP